ncbi:MAG TPA: AraC family transcriptional regulator [Bacteroidetes bacterium]|nr:AraC family transcriptional regulator [Bacteroidota bacterium]
MEPVLYIGIVQSFFAGLMIATKKPQQLHDRIMAGWLFLISLEMIFALSKEYYQQLLAFTFIPFTYGPLMYLYTKFLFSEKPHFGWKNWLHFIPFVVFFVLTFVYRQEKVIALDHYFEHDKLLWLRITYGISFFVSITVYSVLTFDLIRKHQRKIRDLYSFTSEKITLNWLKVVSISFSVTYLAMFIAGAFNMISGDTSTNPLLFSYIGLTLFAFAFSIYGYKQQEIYKHYGIIEKGGENEKEQKGISGSGVKYQRSGLKETEARKYLKQLLKLMEEEKPYLNGELSIQDLTVRLNIPRHYLTQILNEKLKKNFYTFVNEYRVKEVIQMMNDSQYKNYTLLALALEAGFNSKSSFNNIFKNYTGYTPSEYREKKVLLPES